MTDIQLLLQFDEDFISAKQEGEKLEVLARYPKFDHPHYYYRIAEAYYLRFNNYPKSKNYVQKCIEYGLRSNNPYTNNGFADSIAQCMLVYLRNEDTIELRKQFNLSCLCYAYFSKLIEGYGTDSYNSLYSRGRLIKIYDSRPGVRKMISDYYYSGDDLCVEMLSHGDFIRAAAGFKESNENSNAEISFSAAIEDLIKIRMLPQYSELKYLSDIQILELSIENSNFLATKVIADFESGKFDM